MISKSKNLITGCFLSPKSIPHISHPNSILKKKKKSAKLILKKA
jgi:hypothetical protein